jgi:hypothetical protein
MNVRTALIAAAFFAAGPLLAQTPSTGAPAKPPAHQPGVPAQSSNATAKTVKAAPSASVDKVDPAKEAAIRHLMDLTQTSKLGDNFSAYVTKQVNQALSQAMPPDRLAKLIEGFSQKLATAVPASAVTDAAIPIYARAFSMEDIQAIIQFYESPLGQRMINALPQVTRDSEELGVQMEQKGAMNVLQEMSNDYPELKQMLKPEQESDPEAAPARDEAPAPKAAPAPGAGPVPKPAPEPPSK